MEDTYISFTTHEVRVRKIGPMLSSVLDQWPADRVLLTVTHNLKLPDFLKDSGIRIVRSEDYGAFKKHAPVYIDLGIRDYIVIDDDCIFPKGWFENLLKWNKILRGQVLCGKGRVWEPKSTLHFPDSKAIHSEHALEPVPCHVYLGIGTAVFRTDFFEADIFPFPENAFTYSDDIWFSAKLKDSVKIYVVPYSKEEHSETFGRPKPLEYAKEHSLWRTERANDYINWDIALREHRNKLFGK